MTTQQPPSFLQNSGATNTAVQMRMMMAGLLMSRPSAGSLQALSGISPYHGGQYAITAQGSPNMTVNVDSGIAYIAGTQAGLQGMYCCINDAIVIKTISAADPSLPRIDIIYLQVDDQFYSGAANSWDIKYLAGTPASTPVAPTPSGGNYLVIANIAVAAGATSISTGNITSVRTYVCASGGVRRVTSSTNRPTAPLKGDMIYRTDQGYYETYDGSAWQQFNIPRLLEQCILYQNVAVQNLTSGTHPFTSPLVVTFDASSSDTYNGWTGGSGTGTYTVQHTARFQVSGSMSFGGTGSSGNWYMAGIMVNGADIPGGRAIIKEFSTSGVTSMPIPTIVRDFTVGDAITMRYGQESGSTLQPTLSNGYNPRLHIMEVPRTGA